MKKYYMRVHKSFVPVSHKVYKGHECERKGEKYKNKRDKANGLEYYQKYDTDKWLGEELLPNDCESVEDAAIKAIMLEKLHDALNQLSQEDKQIILLLFEGESERSVERIVGVSDSYVHRRKYVILRQLQECFAE